MNKVDIEELQRRIDGKISGLQDQIDKLEAMSLSLEDFVEPSADAAVFAWQQVKPTAAVKKARAKVKVTAKAVVAARKRKYTKRSKFWGKKKQK